MAKVIEKEKLQQKLALEEEQRGKKRKARGSSRLSFPKKVDDDTDNNDGVEAAVAERQREESRRQQKLGVETSLPDSNGFTPRPRKREDAGAGLAHTSVDEAALEARYRKSFGYIAGYLPRNRAHLDKWQRELRSKAVMQKADNPSSPAVYKLQTLIETDPMIRMYVTQMIDQAPDAHKVVTNVADMLAQLNMVVVTAPVYNVDPSQRHAFPMSELFAYMMMTKAGEAVFRNYAFNEAIRAVLVEWCAYLDSPDSAKVLNTSDDGWLSPFAYQDFQLYEYDLDRTKPQWGLASYNEYFHRPVKKEARPVAGPDDLTVIVSANDGHVLAIARNVQRSDEFWLKGEPFSLNDMLNGSPHVDRFVGGYVFQSFLSGANYHRWHAPVDGTVEEVVRPAKGLLFSDAESAGPDPDADLSDGYYASVNTRVLVFINADNPKIGKVCVIPIGITEISSIQMTVQVGQHVKKGDQLGTFSYGGSALALVFERLAIDHFTAPAPPTTAFDPSSGPPIKVNAQIAVANV